MVMQIPTENSVGKSKDCGSEWKYGNILRPKIYLIMRKLDF